ncbi:gliding motility-associated C-terminal domain-containing protein [Fulvivirgaceae bacterium BMA10]|uniref:Gliding motility-associated C-terminal domain-containing protein n=1 Tax=Splendidivirga corallicola TaxID=3051826 RepID=A0ABT8KP71_9BACT|nr:gliding motility-associated C-terminal domain-containing protein [Fulvivirgaceae bacterium BMA10]
MKNFILITVLINLPLVGIAQIFDQITIDFEDVPMTGSVDGTLINNQFEEAFGLTFRLEDGGFPRLAEVGGIRTGFGSDYGNDQPSPGIDIGMFFLTDDGLVSGNNAPPIILEFDKAIDSINGQILDIDFDEIFIIQARDNNENIILEDTIRAGDIGTGDGKATLWGFKLPPCDSGAYSIRLEGKREQHPTGGFGLGLDNLNIFRSKPDLASLVRIEKSNTRCGENNGSITMLSLDNQRKFEFSLNNSSFGTGNLFTGLSSGTKQIVIRDQYKCMDTVEIEIEPSQKIGITDIIISNSAACKDNGSISITASGGKGELEYSIDNITYQKANSFNNLSGGSYNIFVRDEDGCQASERVDLISARQLKIEELNITQYHCTDQHLNIEIIASGGSGTIDYLIDGVEQFDNYITNLEAGEYRVSIRDSENCEFDTIIITSLKRCEVFIPKAFSPNNNGINDYFEILQDKDTDAFVEDFYIYNRWGELIYAKEDFWIRLHGDWWDGTFNGKKVPTGTYAYMIKIRYSDNTTKCYRDGVIVIY